MSLAIVILGSGIIGVSTAYYLSQSLPGSAIHLVDSSPELFASALGLATGFLATDWLSSFVAALGKLSFEEHKRLAEDFNGKKKWGYSRSTGLALASGLDIDFLNRDPRRLCQFFLESCLQRDVQLHHPARAESVDKDMRDELSTIRIINMDTGTISDIPCTKILIAAGAWSPQVFSKLFPSARKRLPISSLAGHSLIVRSPRSSKKHEEKECHAIFTSDEEGYSPEVFSRMGGEIYIAGLNSPLLALPALATESIIDKGAVKRLKKTAQKLLGADQAVDDLEVVRKGLCFRPVTNRGTPILTRIGDENLGGPKTRVPGEGGVWLAAGHGPLSQPTLFPGEAEVFHSQNMSKATRALVRSPSHLTHFEDLQRNAARTNMMYEAVKPHRTGRFDGRPGAQQSTSGTTKEGWRGAREIIGTAKDNGRRRSAARYLDKQVLCLHPSGLNSWEPLERTTTATVLKGQPAAACNARFSIGAADRSYLSIYIRRYIYIHVCSYIQNYIPTQLRYHIILSRGPEQTDPYLVPSTYLPPT
ncbi:hypothetical protein G7Y89_g1063 [Cudoniella acicularis]|uniref:FAD dependent oxidoreductase domain-containing protein n=1 Tax=Cudoniella acicularis TaxID=354080 RepID=A0A8H4WAM6_9HELO|nr:hypothetical protein G7Y89_g1063 [Cudoniella acicularis]